MCGICGKVLFKDVIPDPEQIQTMCRTIVHRGPDDEGVYTAPHIGLGQRRLAIIDLQQSACAPLSNEDQSIWLVFNGEIYNFQELRQNLQSSGHRFSTSSDTEVIIHLYEQEGTDCLHKLRGMFAFALWDQQKKILFCARDRLGKKPFCYTLTPHSFVFGSEIKAITADPDIAIFPDFFAIDRFLSYSFVPSPLTAFLNIKKLKPGEFLTCDLQGNVSTQCYWKPGPSEILSSDPDEIQDELLRRLRESVKLRMVADVPIGAFLSGGVDSSAIVALMAQESSRPISTFSIGFEEEPFSELPYARLLSERYGTDHHEFIVKPDVIKDLPRLIRHYNEPFGDSSALPTYYLSKMTRQHVTVALSGDGGDESFAGYDNYGAILDWSRYDILPIHLRKAAASCGTKLLGICSSNNHIARILRGLDMLAAENVRKRRLQHGTILKTSEKMQIYTPLFQELINQSTAPEDPLMTYHYDDKLNDLDWLMRHDQSFYLPDCLMVKTDIASMANGLEVRCPFLDHKVVEFAAAIPPHLKRHEKNGKIILKNAVKELLPSIILDKPKTGFAPPIAQWFRKELNPFLSDILLDGTCERRTLFEHKQIKKMVDEHTAGKRDWSNRLWVFLNLELWFREFID